MTKRKVSNLSGNVAKHLSYREAWGRIKGSMAHGYYLEAVTLEESIISDRLSSYLVKIGVAEPDTKLERESFAKLIQRWRNCVPENIMDAHFADLQTSVDEWRNLRNKIVHGIVKSHPGTAPTDILDFKKEAEIAAKQGERLAKSVCNWYQREKARLKRVATKSTD